MNATHLCLVRIPICMEGFNVVYIFDGVEIYDAELGWCLEVHHHGRLTCIIVCDERYFTCDGTRDPTRFSEESEKRETSNCTLHKYQWRAPKIFFFFFFYYHKIAEQSCPPQFDPFKLSPWVSHQKKLLFKKFPQGLCLKDIVIES